MNKEPLYILQGIKGSLAVRIAKSLTLPCIGVYSQNQASFFNPVVFPLTDAESFMSEIPALVKAYGLKPVTY